MEKKRLWIGDYAFIEERLKITAETIVSRSCLVSLNLRHASYLYLEGGGP